MTLYDPKVDAALTRLRTFTIDTQRHIADLKAASATFEDARGAERDARDMVRDADEALGRQILAFSQFLQRHADDLTMTMETILNHMEPKQ